MCVCVCNIQTMDCRIADTNRQKINYCQRTESSCRQRIECAPTAHAAHASTELVIYTQRKRSKHITTVWQWLVCYTAFNVCDELFSFVFYVRREPRLWVCCSSILCSSCPLLLLFSLSLSLSCQRKFIVWTLICASMAQSCILLLCRMLRIRSQSQFDVVSLYIFNHLLVLEDTYHAAHAAHTHTHSLYLPNEKEREKMYKNKYLLWQAIRC